MQGSMLWRFIEEEIDMELSPTEVERATEARKMKIPQQ